MENEQTLDDVDFQPNDCSSLLSSIQEKDYEQAGTLLKSIMAQKSLEALDNEKIEVAKSLY